MVMVRLACVSVELIRATKTHSRVELARRLLHALRRQAKLSGMNLLARSELLNLPPVNFFAPAPRGQILQYYRQKGRCLWAVRIGARQTQVEARGASLKSACWVSICLHAPSMPSQYCQRGKLSKGCSMRVPMSSRP